MKFKKATIFGAVTWFIVFILATPLFYAYPNLVGLLFIFVHIVVALMAKYTYIDKVKATNPVKEGVLLGLYWMGIAIALDIIVIVVALGAGTTYFTEAQWTMPVGYAEFVLGGAIAGWIKARK